MADVCQLDLAVVGVGGGSSKHTETLLERGSLAAGNVVDIKTSVVDELSLWSSIADLGNAAVAFISSCHTESHRCTYM